MTKRIDRNKDHLLHNRDWLYEQYIVNKLTLRQIADICGCLVCNVSEYVKKHGLVKKHPKSWNKGLTKETDARIAVMAKKNVESHLGQVAWNKGLTKEDKDMLGIGTYKRTEKHLKDLSKRMSGENHPLYGKHHTPEAIEKIRIASTGRSHEVTEEQRIEISKRAKILWETTNIRERMKVILNSPEVKQKMSGPNNPQFGKPAYPGSGTGKGSYYTCVDGSQCWLRSTFETRIATLLDVMNINWNYESIGYKLGKTGTYYPDFWLLEYNMWIEVKGYMSNIAKQKLIKFHEIYPDIQLNIIYGKDLQEMENMLYNEGNTININEYGISLCDQIQLWNYT